MGTIIMTAALAAITQHTIDHGTLLHVGEKEREMGGIQSCRILLAARD